MSFFMSALRSWSLRRAEKGFTLIELAIVLLIIGLLLTGFFAGLRVYMAQKKLDDTNRNIDEVRIALVEYLKNEEGPGPNGIPGDFDDISDAEDEVNFPCPAGLTVGEGDAGYGQQDINCRTMATNTNANGIWSVDGIGGGVVVIGAVPTETLKIPARYGYDGYGNRLFYAVTQNVTLDDALLAPAASLGQIGISRPGVATPENVHFLVFSPGRDHQGAYSSGGVRMRDCTAGTADTENCDWQEGANNAVFLARKNFSLATGTAEYYDDRLEYSLSGFNEGDDNWWAATESNMSVDVFNYANTDNIIIQGNAVPPRSQLIIDHTSGKAVEVANQGVGGPMILTAGPEPSMAFERWTPGAGSVRQSSWYLGNPADGNENFLMRYTNAGGIVTDNVMRWTETGNVGIGSPNPLYKLHVVGSTYVTDNTGLGIQPTVYRLDVAAGTTHIADNTGIGMLPGAPMLSVGGDAQITKSLGVGATPNGISGDATIRNRIILGADQGVLSYTTADGLKYNNVITAEPGEACATGRAIVKFDSEGRMICSDDTRVLAQVKECDAGEAVTGFKADGTLICSSDVGKKYRLVHRNSSGVGGSCGSTSTEVSVVAVGDGAVVGLCESN